MRDVIIIPLLIKIGHYKSAVKKHLNIPVIVKYELPQHHNAPLKCSQSCIVNERLFALKVLHCILYIFTFKSEN